MLHFPLFDSTPWMFWSQKNPLFSAVVNPGLFTFQHHVIAKYTCTRIPDAAANAWLPALELSENKFFTLHSAHIFYCSIK